LELGNGNSGQFAKTQFTMYCITDFPYESLTHYNGYGIDGFKVLHYRYNNKYYYTLQTQSYAPWNFIGFRFWTLFNIFSGMLWRSQHQDLKTAEYIHK